MYTTFSWSKDLGICLKRLNRAMASNWLLNGTCSPVHLANGICWLVCFLLAISLFSSNAETLHPDTRVHNGRNSWRFIRPVRGPREYNIDVICNRSCVAA